MKNQIIWAVDDKMKERLERAVDYSKMETGFKITRTAIVRHAVEDWLEDFERKRGLEKN